MIRNGAVIEPGVGIVVLAAGESRRMGSAKQLLDINGTPMVRHAVEVALEAATGPVLVVIGAHAAQIRAALDGLPARLLENRRWAEGLGTSVSAAVEEAVTANLRAVIFTLADQPSITSSVLIRIARTHEFLGSPIVASRYGDTTGVPALFASELFPALLQLQGDEGCKSIIKQYRHLAAMLNCPQASVDLDTPDDYAAWVAERPRSLRPHFRGEKSGFRSR